MTRAAGLMAFMLLWLSTVLGLLVSSKLTDNLLHRSFSYDWHQFISLLAIAFTALHVVVLLFDRFMAFSVIQVLVPFIAPYRPLWVGVGVISMYVMLLVTVTYYVRQWIGVRTFRAIHVASFVSYAGATVHGWMAGTDSTLSVTQWMYGGSALVVIFLTTYWLATIFVARRGAPSHAVRAVTGTRRP